ncbi:TetR family transcriptional regulator [Streptomyces cyaneofuscatus]|uniref:TetR family transcriptional regulator n=1 Tax=Streptomyces cyaneofuscatus TaxID=66883 RepID=UPI00364B00F4
MAKQQRALITREQILRAAGEVFAGFGYHRASVDDIIARSGMTKGAVYFHFPGKAAIAESLLARLQDAHPTAAADYPVRLQALITLFNGYAAPPATDPILHGALRLALEQEFQEYEGGDWQERLQLTISGLLSEAADAGELLGHVKPAKAAELLTTILAGMRRYTPVPTAGEGEAERITTMWHLLLPAIAKPGLVHTLDLSLGRPVSDTPEDHHPEHLLTSSSNAPPPHAD